MVQLTVDACSTPQQLNSILDNVKIMHSTVVAANKSSDVNFTPSNKKRGRIETQNRFYSTKKRKLKKDREINMTMTGREKDEVSAAILLSNLN